MENNGCTKKRNRKANFTDVEVRCLLEALCEEKEIINSQLQGAMTARRKREVWERILTKVNAISTRASHTLEEEKRKWKDLKAAVLKEQASQKKTGGGGPPKETSFKVRLRRLHSSVTGATPCLE